MENDTRDEKHEEEDNTAEELEKLTKKLHTLIRKAERLLGTETDPQTGEECWEKLVKGNKVFYESNLLAFISNIGREILPSVREQTTIEGQHPYVTVISCSDSRCSPELIFTEGIGLMFVVRVAGNVIDKTTLGSIEYGIEKCKTKLLLVLGHSKCGAVSAALEESYKLLHGDEEPISPYRDSIHNIVKKILPITNKAVEIHKENKTEALKWAIDENIRNTRRVIFESSEIVQNSVAQKSLTIKLAHYHMKSGMVEEVCE